jgi:twitching motility protein PilJ
MTVLLIVALIAAPAAHAGNDDAKATALLGLAQARSQQLPLLANDAAAGNVDAFRELGATADKIDAVLTRLKHGDPQIGFGGIADRAPLRKNLADVDASWAKLNAEVAKVLAGQRQVSESAAAVDEFDRKLAVLNSRMDEVVKILSERAAPASQAVLASRQMLFADRMQRRAHFVLNGGEEAASAAAGLQRDAQYYGVVLKGLISGNAELNVKAINHPAAHEILSDISKQWDDLAPTVTKLLEAASTLEDTRQAADNIRVESQTFLLKSMPLLLTIGQIR